MPRFEDRGGGRFWEIEQDDHVVLTARGAGDDEPVKQGRREHRDEDAAFYEMGRLIRRQLRRGFTWAGPSRVVAGADPSAAGPGSTVFLDELFAAGDPRFDAELRRATSAGHLAALAARWYADPRPWARRALLAYIDDGCGRPFHKALVKKLFKAAEAAADDEAMAHFLVAFDRLARRALIEVATWNWATRELDRGEVLKDDPSTLARVRRKGKPDVPSPVFSRVTRRYLVRRAARYFRLLGFRDVARYRRAVLLALPRYTEAALATPSRLLDAWGLMHVLYAGSPVLERRPHGIRIAPGHGLGELEPAPQFPAAWADASADLLALLAGARSRTVRAWSLAMLRRDHRPRLDALDVAQVAALLRSPHPEVSSLGAELLPRLRGLEAVPIVTWLELLRVEDLDVVPVIVAVVEKVVTPARLDLAQCIELAGAPIAAVAALGLRWARAKPVRTADELQLLARLARAKTAAVRAEGTAWALEQARSHPAAGPVYVRELCDAPFADVRAPALAAAATTERWFGNPELWFGLAESPYDDVRAAVLANARRWHDTAPPATLRHVWTSAVLAVHRGSATKRRVPRAIAERVVAHPEEADALLPVLGLALRSVRPPERAAALAALARALHRDPSLRERARAHLPELTVTGEVSS